MKQEEGKHFGIIESLLYVAGDEGISLKEITDVLKVEPTCAIEWIKELKKEYDQSCRGFFLQEADGRYFLTTKKEYSPYIQKLLETERTQSLSQAALETLAIIAYKQPITRNEIEEIRGVKTEKPLQTLVAKVLIKEVGRKEGTGRPILYGTTPEFLRIFGLKTLEELPPLEDFEQEARENEEIDLFFNHIGGSLDK